MAENAERLADMYWELQTDEEPIGLEEFVQRACAGEYGAVEPGEVRAFLESVEERLVRQIEDGEGTAHDGAARDDLVEETRAWIDDLLTKFCKG
jgi:hypothetical protein